jgi:hypothetical protein
MEVNMRKIGLFVAGMVSLWGMCASPAMAQTAMTYDQNSRWGTSPGGVSVPGAADSANSHLANGYTAGQVQAAKLGNLTTTNYVQQNYSIGVQNNNSLTGNGSNIAASQSGSNTGATSNNGQNTSTSFPTSFK